MLIGGVVGASVLMAVAVAKSHLSGPGAATAGALATLAGLSAIYGFGMGAYMTYVSKIGKVRTREILLDLAQRVRPWTGDETVLDVGCGRGLMLIGAAQRLTSGRATGIDLWRAEDQADNSPAAPRENAWREGVADRVRIETADARALPFADASFDAVLSHWVVHNLAEVADRERAIDEMLRVLRPGGVLVLADIANHTVYRQQLVAKGLADMREYNGGLQTTLIGALSAGSFRPQAIVGIRH